MEARIGVKGYTVFNVGQIEGLPENYTVPESKLTSVERIERAEAFLASTRADIRYPGDRAFYYCDGDYIQMLVIEAFRDAESFYATLAHEGTRWTKHSTRLERDFDRKTWGDEGYAREEFVAELGPAFLCAHLGLTPEVRDDHAADIASWLTVQERQARDLLRRRPCAEGGRFPARAATAESRGRLRATSVRHLKCLAVTSVTFKRSPFRDSGTVSSVPAFLSTGPAPMDERARGQPLSRAEFQARGCHWFCLSGAFRLDGRLPHIPPVFLT